MPGGREVATASSSGPARTGSPWPRPRTVGLPISVGGSEEGLEARVAAEEIEVGVVPDPLVGAHAEGDDATEPDEGLVLHPQAGVGTGDVVPDARIVGLGGAGAPQI